MTRLLDDEEITRQLADLAGWQWRDGALHALVEAPSFSDAVALVTAVADEAEQMNHHPDIDLRYRTVRFELSTHSAGGVTQLDVELAHRITRHARRLGATAVERDGD